ncbi:MAG TPA: protein translocase subunit SecD [Jatrophihabitans sp.]|uniref:protein translocase subunit SecD n=1 Tax=Jatrophihabitans sp. TaxID=1932789 RepID=UPI002F0C86EE
MAPTAGTLRVGRYFAVLLGLFVVLYGIVFLPNHSRTPKLGLDLEGGAQVILKAQTENGKAPTKASMDQARQIISNRVNGLGVSSAEVVTQGNDRIVVSVPGAGADDIKDVGGTALLQMRPLLMEPVSAAPAPSGSGSATPSASASTSPSGSAAPSGSSSPSGSAAPSGTAKPAGSGSASTSPSPRGRIVPNAAATTSPAPSASPSAPSASGSAAPSPSASGSAAPSPSGSGSAAVDPSAPVDQWKQLGFTPPTTPAALAAMPADRQAKLKAAIDAWPCNDTTKPLDVPSKPMITCDQANQTKYLLGPVIVPGTEVKTATAQAPGTSPGQFSWTVSLDLKPKGQAAWADYTSKHNVKVSPNDIGNQVADTLDTKVIVASTIQDTIAGTTEISGNFNEASATNLANSLKYGALPLSFVQQSATSVSPTLGIEQMKAGLLAGGIGLFLVVIYSLLYYRALGLVTVVSLAVSGGLTYAMLVILGEQIGFTLTLAGIAGFIVAVGITADSFVVFFERIKDEVHEGRTMRVAIPRAWERSRRTILSADTVSFLAAATLYYFAAGEVKGFAFTLGLSTVIDLIVVFLFTHPLVSLFSRSKAFGSARFTGLDQARAGGIVTRTLPEPELATAGVGAGMAAPAMSSGAMSSGSVPLTKAKGGGGQRTSEPVHTATAMDAGDRPPAGSATRAATTKPTVTTGAATPITGATAAERAAARRGLRRQTDDQSGRDDS